MDQTTYHQIHPGLTEVRRQGERFVEILDGTVEIDDLEGKRVYELAPDGRKERQIVKGEEGGENSFHINTPILEITTIE